MSRPLKCRRICDPPKMEGFKPYGINACGNNPITLKMEEYESIRLVNYEILSQDVAASQMNVSRPTFTRIYNNALRQIAIAFVEGRSIEIEGGNYKLDKEWYRCKKCYRLIEGLENHHKCRNCPQYGESELVCLNRSFNNINSIKPLN